MKFFKTGSEYRLELTRRNLTVLLAKLDDPISVRTLAKVSKHGYVEVVAVEDAAHYGDREPGFVYMPTSGETL